MFIKTKRVYDSVEPADGVRILVDRLWPRGISREAKKIDCWLKDIAPSNELRKWYNHDAEKWDDFREKYFEELENTPEALAGLADIIKNADTVTLLYSSKETEINNAAALKLYLEQHK